MGNGKKNKRRGGDDDGTGLGAFAGGLAGNIAGQAIGQLLGDAFQRKTPSAFGGPNSGPDLPSRMLLTLSDEGPKTVAELVHALDAPLQPLLDAIAAARRAKLIQRVDKSAVVRITEPGCQVAAVVRQKLGEQGRVTVEEPTAEGDGA
jgi:hypothetical protein